MFSTIPIKSYLYTELYASKRAARKKSYAVMLFKFQMRNSSVSGPKFVSISPLSKIALKCSHSVCSL